MPTANPREILDVVNENDEPISTATRREVHEEALLHRAVHVLLGDGTGRVILQRRSRDKRTYPGLLTSSASGHVPAGEAPHKAARREVEEELGLVAPDLERIGSVHVEDLDVGEREIAHVFAGTLDAGAELAPDPDEVLEVHRVSPATIRAWLTEDPGRLAATFVPVFERFEDEIQAHAGAP